MLFRKIFSLFLIVLLLIFSASCGDKGNEQPDSSDSTFSDTITTNNKNTSWHEGNTLKILAIGNSFSINTLEHVAEITKCLGIEEIFLGNLYIGGCPIKTHAENARNDAAAYRYYNNNGNGWSFVEDKKMSDALKEQSWDIIVMQQASYFSGKEDSYSELDFLIQYVRRIVGESPKLVWNMTWAYQNGYSGLDDYGKKQSVMYTKILRAVDKKIKPNENFDAILPVGTAIQNARTSFVGDTLTTDGMHLNQLGMYIAGLTLVYKITGLPINNVSFAPQGINQRQKDAAIEAAVNAVKTPFNITDATDK